jgi:hypothetical protein
LLKKSSVNLCQLIVLITNGSLNKVVNYISAMIIMHFNKSSSQLRWNGLCCIAVQLMLTSGQNMSEKVSSLYSRVKILALIFNPSKFYMSAGNYLRSLKPRSTTHSLGIINMCEIYSNSMKLNKKLSDSNPFIYSGTVCFLLCEMCMDYTLSRFF